MNDLQKMGGISALINAAAYIVGLGLVIAFLAPYLEAEPAQYVEVIVNNQTLMFVWHLLIYLVAGVCMVPMVLALNERLKEGSPALAQIATAFGIIWTVTVIGSGMIIINNMSVITELYAKDPFQATTVWMALSAIEDGLGGAIELPGGTWILLVSLAALQASQLPKLLNYLGVIVGASGILTVIPSLYNFGYVFGLGAIVWFIWVGVFLARNSTSPVASVQKSFNPLHT
jgi:hypothetical protein